MRDDRGMRTTVDIEDDVLQAAKEIAERQGTSAGKVISDLIRRALAPPRLGPRVRNGVPLLAHRPAGAPALTLKIVHELQED
jgi:hypothetical protein